MAGLNEQGGGVALVIILTPFTANRAGGVRGRVRRPLSWRCGWSPLSGHRGVHWNITVLDPSVLVLMFETATCDPLTMQ